MAMPQAGNLFADAPAAGEQVTELLTLRALKIERIISSGQASPPGFWYDQEWDEWVVLLSGAARLRFENEAEARNLAPGDYVCIPAHVRHRVDWTSDVQPTVWLAVHFPPQKQPQGSR